jgi:hypothetical protein
LPLSSDGEADQGCRKRRNQVPDWSEIGCRFPPKSPAAFDRNRVPLSSDFCIRRSREANLECGFLLEGDAVSAVLVEAVLNIFESKAG